MHTAIATGSGLILLGIMFACKKLLKIDLLRYFAWIWLIVCIIHLEEGVRAGYSLQTELAIHLLVFGLPAAVWWLATKRA